MALRRGRPERHTGSRTREALPSRERSGWIAATARGKRTGLASVYRAVEVLNELGLIKRLDIGDGTARYEPVDPGGTHHHHLVCDRCGRVTAFEDDQLERAIATLAKRVDHAIDAHDVLLRGACPNCR